MVVPDIAPFLSADPALVRRMLTSLADHAAVTGVLAVGIRYTAHDTERLSTFTGIADAVVWADRGMDGTVRLGTDR